MYKYTVQVVRTGHVHVQYTMYNNNFTINFTMYNKRIQYRKTKKYVTLEIV